MRYIDTKPRRLENKNAVLISLSMLALLVGVISAFENGTFAWRGLLANLSTEVIGAVIVYYIIDQFINRHDTEQKLKDKLIRELENPDSGIATRAAQELRTYGWLQDGSLYGWFIQRANWEGAYLRDANLNGVGLYRCNLKDARIYVSQMVQMNDLRKTIMPDGTLYDGRYCLQGDIEWATKKYDVNFMAATVEDLAGYYETSVDDFLSGQKWAWENLEDYDRKIPSYLERLHDIGAI